MRVTEGEGPEAATELLIRKPELSSRQVPGNGKVQLLIPPGAGLIAEQACLDRFQQRHPETASATSMGISGYRINQP